MILRRREWLVAAAALASRPAPAADHKLERLTLEAWFVRPDGRAVPRRLPVSADGVVDASSVRGWQATDAPAFLRLQLIPPPPALTAEIAHQGKNEGRFDFQADDPGRDAGPPPASVPVRFADLTRVPGRSLVLKLPGQAPITVGPLQLAPPPSVVELPLNPIHLARLAEAHRLLHEKGAQVWPGFALYQAPVLLRSSEARARFVLLWNEQFPAPAAVTMADGGRQPTKFERLSGDHGFTQPLYAIRNEVDANALDRHLNFAFDPFGMLRGELVALVGRGTATVRMTPVLGAPESDPFGDAEENIATTIHECFHVHQFHRQWMKRKGLTGGNAVIIESPLFTPEQAALFECERRALRAAYETTDLNALKSRLCAFLACRWTRWKRQADPGRKDLENLFESIEGTAAYVAFRALSLTQADYQPLPALSDDPSFHAYRRWDGGKPLLEAHEVPVVAVHLLEQKTAYYNLGTYVGAALDRLLPNWKSEYETTSIQLDQLVARAVGLKANDPAVPALLTQARQQYDYAALAKQAQVRLREMK